MDLKQNDDGDWAVENNALVLVSGSAEVRQRVLQRLRTFMGEWFLDFGIGVPYFQEIFQKDPDPAVVSSVLQNEILNTLGVLELHSFDLDYVGSTRIMTATFKIRAYNGDLLLFKETI